MSVTRMRAGGFLCVLALATSVCFGQSKQNDDAGKTTAAQTEQSDGRHYQLVFVAKEVEGGKVINARRYETDTDMKTKDIASSGFGSIRTGSRIPVATGTGSSFQYTYQNVEVNFDFDHARLEGDHVSLMVTAEISSIDPVAPDSALRVPITRQNKWVSRVTVPLGKPTVIFSSDDVSSKRTMQIELTVTQVR